MWRAMCVCVSRKFKERPNLTHIYSVHKLSSCHPRNFLSGEGGDDMTQFFLLLIEESLFGSMLPVFLRPGNGDLMPIN